MTRFPQATFGRHSEALTRKRFLLRKEDANKVVHPTRPFPPMDERPSRRPDQTPRPTRDSNPNPPAQTPTPPERRDNS
jgi:hypothetical protein